MTPRVAIIGSGLAGLTTAYLLRREGHEVYLVERSEQLGFHSSSVVVPSDDKSSRAKEWVVDVPMRSFQGGYYPLLIALYRHLGLALKPSNFTFSFSHLSPSSLHEPRISHSPRGSLSTYFIHSGSSGLSFPAYPITAYTSALALARFILRWISFAVCYILFLVLSFISWHSLLPLPLTLGSCLRYTSYLPLGLDRLVDAFVNDIVVPLFSAVGTMTTADVLNTPLRTILDYVHCTLGTSHYTLGDCSARDVARLLVDPIKRQGEDHVRLGTEITSIRWSTCAVDGKGAFEMIFKEGEAIQVDRVVIATQASSALALLDMLEKIERKADIRRLEEVRSALKQVKYRDTIVITHRDPSVLPNPRDIRDINLVVPLVPSPNNRTRSPSMENTPPLSPVTMTPSSSSGSGLSTPMDGSVQIGMPYFRPTPDEVYAMGTHAIRPPRGFEAFEPLLQTTNPVVPIVADSVLGIAKLERALPLEHPESVIDALSCPPESDGSGSSSRIHFVGSYAYPGIPLLEGCVGSAIRTVEEIIRGQETTRRYARQATGGVDWSAGAGGFVGRVWRWRRRRHT